MGHSGNQGQINGGKSDVLAQYSNMAQDITIAQSSKKVEDNSLPGQSTACTRNITWQPGSSSGTAHGVYLTSSTECSVQLKR